jgi:hypothetical protein
METFLEQAKSLVAVQNVIWQRTEEKFASAAGSARDFQKYQSDIDIYPNLKFRTMHDSDVRPEHAANEGVIKPVNEWKRIPPLDYNCRCWLEQTDEKPDGRDISEYNRIANNPALSGKLFTGESSYFQKVSPDDRQTVNANAELMKEYMPYNRQIKAGDNSVFVNDFADLKDLADNIDAAKIVAGFLKKDVYIRPHVNVSGHKNPEFGIETPNKLADLKTMAEGSKKFFKNRIASANKQNCKYVVMNIDNYKGVARLLSKNIADGFYNRYKNNEPMNTNIEKLVIIRNGKAIQLTRKQIEKGMFNDLDKLDT